MLPDSQGRPADGADDGRCVGGDRRTHDALAQSTASDVTAYLLAGPAAFGLLGHGLDRWLGSEVGVPAGILLGLGLSLYIVWVRYGRP